MWSAPLRLCRTERVAVIPAMLRIPGFVEFLREAKHGDHAALERIRHTAPIESGLLMLLRALLVTLLLAAVGARLWAAADFARDVQHWAYKAPRRPSLPVVRDPSWMRTPIDAFISVRLEIEGLSPSPEAPRETLIRRVSLDLFD